MPYPGDVARRRALIELLASCWPHVPEAIDRARAWGADWCSVSTPFARWAGPRAAAVVGVIEMPIRLARHDVVVAGVHGVCTHPAHRGRGLFRDAMEEALASIDARGRTAILWTEEPGIYERFGFRAVRESVLELDARGAIPAGARRLDPDRPADLERLVARLRGRAPVSEQLASRDPGWHVLIDLALLGVDAPTLVEIGELDAVVAITEGDGALRIDDVIAPRMPPIDAVLEWLRAPPGEGSPIAMAFRPDAIASRWTAVPHPATDVLMVRGAWPIEPPFALSPLVRC